MPGQIIRSEIDEEISEVRVQGGRRCLGTFRVSPLVRQQPPNCQSHAQLQVQEISVRVLVVLVLQFCCYCFASFRLSACLA